MTDYKLSYRHSFSHYEFDNSICLGQVKTQNLTDEELIVYIADSLEHEHIHKVLFEMFNSNVSGLFDAVGHLFRDSILHVKAIRNTDRVRWKFFIDHNGFDSFLKMIRLNKSDIVNADILCKRRDRENDI